MRPRTFDEFIGQDDACRQIKVALEAAQRRSNIIDHVLLAGPPGLGKTTISQIIANTMRTKCVETIASVLKAPNDLISTLVHLKRGDVLFIDEIHALPINLQEYLYTAMEDYKISSIHGQRERRVVTVQLQKFVLVGATTMEGLISEPMLARFGIVCRLKPYDVNSLVLILKREIDKEGWKAQDGVLEMIASRARATPRVALRHFRRVKDFCMLNTLTTDAVKETYTMLGITEYGLTHDDRCVISVLYDVDRAMGIEALSAMTHINQHTLAQVVEPHLMRCGFILRTPRGRVITKKGKEVRERWD